MEIPIAEYDSNFNLNPASIGKELCYAVKVAAKAKAVAVGWDTCSSRKQVIEQMQLQL